MGSKRGKLPSNAFRYYVQMYFKRKHTLESRYSHPMVDVHKSWQSLSESERHQFDSQYNEYKIKYNQQLADRLKEAEPFMKRKKAPNRPSSSSCNNCVIVTDVNPDMIDGAVTLQTEEAKESTLRTDQSETECSSQLIYDNNKTPVIDNQTDTNIHILPHDNTERCATSTSEDPQTEHLSEPAPPTVINAKELYCMLKSKDEDKWASLPQIDKKRYSRAVYVLKKEYITRYKKYLQSLTPRELFDYYNKKVF